MSDVSLRLDGQVALVTGAGSGIGRATALCLAQAGAAVAINHLPYQAESANGTLREIQAAGGRGRAIAADVSLEADVERMFADCIAQFGTLHILVNNAGIQRDSAFENMTIEQWKKVIDVNLTGQFLCARSAIREFLRRGRANDTSKAIGKIICMSSVHQRIPWASHGNYAASKGGVALLMQTLAQEFAGRGIRVNSIAPGAIRTPINRDSWNSASSMTELLKLIPYGRIGEVDDITNTVLWLASDASDYINGATIFVDGAMSMYPNFRGNG